MKEIDPTQALLDLSDNPLSRPTKNHWAIKIDDTVRMTFGHESTSEREARRVLREAQITGRTGNAKAEVVMLRQGRSYDFQKPGSANRQVHNHEKIDPKYTCPEGYTLMPEKEEFGVVVQEHVSGIPGIPGATRTLRTQSYYDRHGNYRGDVPDPENGAPYGWRVVNGRRRPIDPTE